MKHVLCIEDQPDIRMILKFTLEAKGAFAVREAGTGTDGLAQARATPPDVILLDYSLPDMDGPDVLVHLKSDASTAKIPVIVLTAKTLASDIEACIARGALDVLSKPFNPARLPRQIEEILARHTASP